MKLKDKSASSVAFGQNPRVSIASNGVYIVARSLGAALRDRQLTVQDQSGAPPVAMPVWTMPHLLGPLWDPAGDLIAGRARVPVSGETELSFRRPTAVAGTSPLSCEKGRRRRPIPSGSLCFARVWDRGVQEEAKIADLRAMRSDPARQVPGEGVNTGFPPASSTMAWFARRKWPLLVAALFFITGIAFTFWWCPVVDHLHQWIDSEDLWDTYRAAQWVGWGNEGAVYQHGIYSIVFPGIDVVLAPVAIVSTHYRLIDPYPYFIRYPSALPLLMPYVLAISVPALLVFDYLAEFLDVVPRRRILLCWMQGALLWPLVVMWGHPEEAIALAFIVLSMVSAFSERWTRAGWYLGFGVAFQPTRSSYCRYCSGLLPKVRGGPRSCGLRSYRAHCSCCRSFRGFMRQYMPFLFSQRTSIRTMAPPCWPWRLI